MAGKRWIPVGGSGAPGPAGAPGGADAGDVSVYGATVTYGSPPANAHLSTNDFRGDFLSIHEFGAVPDGTTNNWAAFTAAIAEAKALGGASIYIPKGTYKVTPALMMDSSASNIRFYGEGPASIILSGGSLSAGTGLFDLNGCSDVEFADLLIDGAVITPVGVLYGTITDPMQSSLSSGTSIWVHGGSKRIKLTGVTIQHTGGYAFLLDATSVGDIDGVTVSGCTFQNNRPHLFGTSGGDLNYGSWTGGLHYQGDGSSFAVRNLLVTGTTFRRNTGNCLWGHLYAFSKIHSNIRVIGCHFVDCGLDGVLMGGVIGGCVQGCSFRRIGYVCTDDTSPSVPKWLPSFNATGLDASGIVRAVNYTGNTFVSINGGCIDADGFGQGNIHGNICIIPAAGEPEYTEDSIASFGPGGVGANWTYGINFNNSQNQADAAVGVAITGNTFINMGAGAVRLYSARSCEVSNNDIIHPASPNAPPILIGNIGSGGNQRAQNNVVADNMISWNPSVASPVVVEDNTIAAFQAGDKNWVVNNRILNANGNAYEFKKDSVTSSTTRTVLSSMANGVTASSETWYQREDRLTRWYKNIAGTATSIMTLQDAALISTASPPTAGGPMLNVTSGAGVGGTVTTGPRTTSAFDDAMVTGKGYFDAFVCLTDTTFLAADANSLGTSVAMLRYKQSVGYIEQSIAVSSGARVWVPLAANVAGAVGDVQFNNGAGGFGASANLNWNDTSRFLTINGAPAGSPPGPAAGLVVLNSYVQSAGGFVSLSNSYQSIQTPTGGFNGAGLGIIDSASKGGYVQLVPLQYAGDYPAPLTNASFGANHGLIWVSVANATPTPVTSVQLNTNMAVNSAVGFVTANTATNSIQAPSGGVTGKWIIATDSLFFLAMGSNPALAGADQARLYLNKTGSPPSYELRISINGGAYAPFAVSAAAAAPTSAVQFNAGSNTLGGTSNFTWDNSGQKLTVTGITATAGFVTLTSYIQSAEGFVSLATSYQSIQTPSGGFYGLGIGINSQASPGKGGYVQLVPLAYIGGFPVALTNASFTPATDTILWNSAFNGTLISNTSTYLNCNAAFNSSVGFVTSNTATNSIQAPSGGVSAKWLIASDSLFFLEEATPALSAAGQARIYADSTTHTLKISQNNGAYTNFGGSTPPAGSDTYVQFNSGGSFGASANLTWNNGAKVLAITGATGTAGLVVLTSYIQSAEGVVSLSNSYQSIQVPTGGLNSAGLGIGGGASSKGGYIQIVTMNYGSGLPVALTNASFTTSTDAILWNSAVNGTVTPNTSTFLNSNAAFNSAVGFVTANTAVNSIQAPSGGVSGRWLTASDSIFFLAENPPALSGAQQARIYLDNGPTHTGPYSLLVSINGAAYAALGGTATAAGSTGQVQYNGGSGAFAATSNFSWNAGGQSLAITGATGTAGLVTLTSYIQSAEGFVSLSNSYQSIQAPTGGFNGAGVGVLGGSSSRGGYLQIATMNYGSGFPTALTNASFNASTDVILWNSSTNNTASPNVSTSLNTNAAVNSAVGFVTANTATNSIQAPVGGVTSKWLIASDSLFFLSMGSDPAVAGTDQARIYLNKTGISNYQLRISVNGSAYGAFASSAGSAGHIQYSNGTGGFLASANNFWDNTNRILTINGVASQQGILCQNAYIQSDGGFLVSSSNSAANAIQAPNGGVTVKFLNGTVSLTLSTTTTGIATAAAGRMIFDGSLFQVCLNGSTYVPLATGSATAAGAAGQVQYSNGSGTFVASSNFVWQNGLQQLQIFGVGGTAGLSVSTGFVQADGGFLATSGVANAYNTIQAPTGGVFARSHRSSVYSQLGNSSGIPAVTTFDTFQAGAIYWDNSVGRLQIFNGGSWGPLTAAASAAGSDTQVQYNSAGALGATANFTWASGLQRLSVFGLSGTAGIAVASGFIQADGGFLVNSSTAWNSIQTPGGMKALTYIQAGPLMTTDQGTVIGVDSSPFHAGANGIVAMVVDGYDPSGFQLTVPSVIGRHIFGSPGSFNALQSGSVLMTFGGRGSFPGGVTASNSSSINFTASENWNSSGTVGAEISFATTPNGFGTGSRANRMFVRNSGLVEIAGISGNTALQINNGWVSAVDTTNGGFHAGGNQFNVIQAPTGGAYVGLGYTCDQALYPRTFGTGATPNAPAFGYAAFGHRSGSTFWYYNPSISAYSFVDFAAAGGGGVTSLRGTSAGLILVDSGSGPQLGPVTGNVTLTLNTGGNVTFGSVTTQTGAFNSGAAGITFQTTNTKFQVDSNGNISAFNDVNVSTGGFGSYKVNGTRVINNLSVFCGNGILMRNGCGATGYNFFVQDNGNGTWRYRGGGTVTINIGGTSYTWEGGVLTQVNFVPFNQFDVNAP